jgi:hypothetical protein
MSETDERNEAASATPLEDSTERGTCRSHPKDEARDAFKTGCLSNVECSSVIWAAITR